MFESPLDGRFAICHQRRGADSEPLISGNNHCVFPAPSDCGRYIAYAESDSTAREAQARLMVFDRQAKRAELLAANGTFPSFSSDGKTIYFEQDRRKIMRVDTETGEQSEIFSPEKTGFEGYQISKPNLSADGKTLFVTSDRGGRWHVWKISLETHQAWNVGRGCEPVSLQNGDAVAWISPKGRLSGTEALMMDFRTGKVTKLLPDYPGRFQYFPSVDRTGQFFICSVSNGLSLFRRAASYSLVAVDLASGKFNRLTGRASSCRWGRWISGSTFGFYFFDLLEMCAAI